MLDPETSTAHGGPFPTKPTETTSFPTHYKDSSTTLASDDSYNVMTSKANKHTWVGRLLDIVCAKTSRGRKSPMNSPNFAPQGPEHHDGSSPWLVPVYVLSTRQDKDKHWIPMEAKCTIDTGNMQGNIVSRSFVKEVLKYPESAFLALTKEEEAGAIGITGHQLVPEAAIHLTWYHKKSTRVFRDMRFLISPNEYFDLIIGAGSIQRDRLLDVPNLIGDRIIPENLVSLDSADKIFNAVKAKFDGLINSKLPEINQATRDGDEAEKTKLENERARLRTESAKFQKQGGEILTTNAALDQKKADMTNLMNTVNQKLKTDLSGDPPEYQEKLSKDNNGSGSSGPRTSGYEKNSKSSAANQSVKRKPPT